MDSTEKKLPLPMVPRALVQRIRLKLLSAQLRSDPRPHVVFPLVDTMMKETELLWQRRGIPSSPYAWCETQYRNRYPEMIPPSPREGDPLSLMYALSHSALTNQTRSILALHLLAGISIAELALNLGLDVSSCRIRIQRGLRAFARVLPQCINAGVSQCLKRQDTILAILWATHQAKVGSRYNKYLLLHTLLNQLLHQRAHSEISSFLAIIHYFHARLDALVLSDNLQNENRTQWNHSLIKVADKYLKSAIDSGRVGPFLIRAQILQTQMRASTWEDIHWIRVADLYRRLELYSDLDLLDYRDLNWGEAVARNAELHGGLTRIEQIKDQIGESYALSYAKARLLCRMGKMKEALVVFQQALQQAPNQSKSAMLTQIAIHSAEPTAYYS
jgi:predicted RNA polymerase sigma factor